MDPTYPAVKVQRNMLGLVIRSSTRNWTGGTTPFSHFSLMECPDVGVLLGFGSGGVPYFFCSEREARQAPRPQRHRRVLAKRPESQRAGATLSQGALARARSRKPRAPGPRRSSRLHGFGSLPRASIHEGEFCPPGRPHRAMTHSRSAPANFASSRSKVPRGR